MYALAMLILLSPLAALTMLLLAMALGMLPRLLPVGA